MSSLVLDAGVLVAIDREDRAMAARLRAALDAGLSLRTHPLVVAQAWRDPGGRQASLGRFLRAVEVVDIDDALGRSAGVLCARSRTEDPIDAALVLLARTGDRILTGDPGDMRRLVAASGRSVTVIEI